MHSTKTEILARLKRNDGATVDDLASNLGLAPMTIRQHLTALERDDLVRAEEVRRATGRPHHLYRLTTDGHRSVSDGYDRMLALLVEQAGGMEPGDVAGATPDERRALLFRRAAGALATRYQGEIRALRGGEQAGRLVAILREHGGFAEWHALGDAFEVRDFGCVFRESMGDAMACAWHEEFLGVALGAAVQPAAEPDGCAACCRYIIPGRVSTPVST
jgi:predicted ArsR family transcriptional regulator